MKTPKELGRWFQNVKLPDGTETNPDRPVDITWESLKKFYPYFANKSVLEVGCNGGAMMLKLEKEYKCSVSSFDINPLYVKQSEFIKEVFDLKAKVFHADLAKDEFEQHDVVFMCGVLYHLDDIIGCFRKCLRLAKEVVIMETAFSKDERSIWEFGVSSENYSSTLTPSLRAVEDLVHYCGAEILSKIIYDHNRCSYVIKPRVRTERIPGMHAKDSKKITSL